MHKTSSPEVIAVFVRALVIANGHGHKQITSRDLADAIDAAETSEPDSAIGDVESRDEQLVPVPSTEMQFSEKARIIIDRAVESVGAGELDLDSLRAVLSHHSE